MGHETLSAINTLLNPITNKAMIKSKEEAPVCFVTLTKEACAETKKSDGTRSTRDVPSKKRR